MAVTIKLGQTVPYGEQEVDASGVPLPSQLAFDAPPTWASTSPNIATVAASADGLTAVVTAVAPGSTTIECSGKINGGTVSGSDVVIVLNNVAGLKLVPGTPTP